MNLHAVGPARYAAKPMIRRYQIGVERRIAQIFYDAVHQSASGDYTPEQLNAWTSRPLDFDHWRRRCQSKRPLVKELAGQVVGFIELDPDGHIDCADVDPAHAGTGAMSQIMREVKRVAIEMNLSTLLAEVSKTARPFFQRHGFVWVRDNRVDIRGVSIENFIMQCDLNAESCSCGCFESAARATNGNPAFCRMSIGAGDAISETALETSSNSWQSPRRPGTWILAERRPGLSTCSRNHYDARSSDPSASE